jgi:5-azacytidine-induced protein 1
MGCFWTGKKRNFFIQNKWKNDKTKEIREMTIKGLEPELKRMMDTHQKEKKALEYKF